MPDFNFSDRPEYLLTIAAQFAASGTITQIQPFGSGNINDTFLVSLENATEPRFVLQRVNTQVFRQPEAVMQNLRIFCNHVCDRLQHTPLTNNRRWEVPRILGTKAKADHWIAPDGSFWRAISFIDGSQTFDTVQNLAHASEVGYALGTFHRLVSDLAPDKLADTLEGFHITPRYLEHYNTVIAQTHPQASPELNYCLRFVSDRQQWATVLEDAKAQGKLPLRPIHGDPKVNNIMIDTTTQQAVSLVDLDTVKPGLVHYDIGDCLRSGCNPAGEETTEWQTVYFEPDVAKAMLQSYLAEAQSFLSAPDYDYLYDAIRLIAFELGVRFLTDYLQGNIYFKVRHPEHNLVRALVQFQLTESIEAQASTLQALVQDLK